MVNLEKKIAEAKKVVEKLDLEEPYKSGVFSAVLTQLLLKEKTEEEKPKRIEIRLEQRVEKIAKDANVAINQLTEIFDFEENDLTLRVEISGENEAEKQLRATLAILTGLSYCYKREKILSADLRKKLENLGIHSLVHLATNLVKHRRLILPRGKPKSHKFGYKITVPGKKEGLKIIREFMVAEAKT